MLLACAAACCSPVTVGRFLTTGSCADVRTLAWHDQYNTQFCAVPLFELLGGIPGVWLVFTTVELRFCIFETEYILPADC